MSTQQNSANAGILAAAKDWTKASQAELAWNENDPVPITKAKFNKLCCCKHIREEEEQKWCEAEEAEKHQVEAEEAKRQAEVEAWVKAAKEVERKWKEAKAQKKRQQVESAAGEAQCLCCARLNSPCKISSGTRKRMACMRCAKAKERCKWPEVEVGLVKKTVTTMTTSPRGGEKKKRVKQATQKEEGDDEGEPVLVGTQSVSKGGSRGRESYQEMVDHQWGKLIEAVDKGFTNLSDMVTASNVVQHSMGQWAQQQFESLQDFMGEMATFGYELGESSLSRSSSELGENEAEEVAEEVATLYKEQAEAERAEEKGETEGAEEQEKEVESQGEDKGKGKQKVD
ncbi:hypothetical protein ID866_11309 [Astraeus odoratus]|nr:hypothetical protein ID866_11309 [Astraeus odoratus]